MNQNSCYHVSRDTATWVEATVYNLNKVLFKEAKPAGFFLAFVKNHYSLINAERHNQIMELHQYDIGP